MYVPLCIVPVLGKKCSVQIVQNILSKERYFSSHRLRSNNSDSWVESDLANLIMRWKHLEHLARAQHDLPVKSPRCQMQHPGFSNSINADWLLASRHKGAMKEKSTRYRDIRSISSDLGATIAWLDRLESLEVCSSSSSWELFTIFAVYVVSDSQRTLLACASKFQQLSHCLNAGYSGHTDFWMHTRHYLNSYRQYSNGMWPW